MADLNIRVDGLFNLAIHFQEKSVIISDRSIVLITCMHFRDQLRMLIQVISYILFCFEFNLIIFNFQFAITGKLLYEVAMHFRKIESITQKEISSIDLHL